MASAPVFRGCPRCGGGLAVEIINGARGMGCLDCDVVVLTRADLRGLISGEPTEEVVTEEGVPLILIDGDEEELRIGKKGAVPGMLGIGASIALALFTGIVGIGLGGAVVLIAVAANGARPPAAPVDQVAVAEPTPPEPAVAGVVPATPVVDDAAVSAPTDAAPPADPPPAEVPVPEPAPLAASAAPAEPAREPVAPTVASAATKPAPAAAGRRAKGSAVDRGWTLISAGDYAGAQAAFAEGIATDPTNGEANYGVGYALLKQGQSADAKNYLCAALGMNVSVDTRREAQGLLERSGLECP